MNVAWWCRVTAALDKAASVQPGTPFAQAYADLLATAKMIAVNYADATLVKLPISHQKANAAVESIHEIISDAERTSAITVEEMGKLKEVLSEYRTVLEAELAAIDAYYVQQQGAYSTRILIDSAETALCLPGEILPLLGEEAKRDLREAGRCLVFQLPTAAGFHVARATETVIRALMCAAGCPLEGQRNWGAYIRALQEREISAGIVHHLEQIKDLHRNPVIHPEVTLTMSEAVALWSICTTLMGTILREIHRLKPEIVVSEAAASASPAKAGK